VSIENRVRFPAGLQYNDFFMQGNKWRAPASPGRAFRSKSSEKRQCAFLWAFRYNPSRAQGLTAGEAGQGAKRLARLHQPPFTPAYMAIPDPQNLLTAKSAKSRNFSFYLLWNLNRFSYSFLFRGYHNFLYSLLLLLFRLCGTFSFL
jgi:hypothetical protein